MSSSFIPKINSILDLDNYVSSLHDEGLNETQVEDKLKRLKLSEEWVNKGLILLNTLEAEDQILSIEKDKGFTQLLAGSAISLLGFFIFFYVYWQYDNQYLICFGAILYGYFMARKGYVRYLNPQLPTTSGLKHYRDRRFKKIR